MTPHQSRRLSGWVVLLALAGVGLGTVVALSRRSSKRPHVVLPTPRAPLPPAAVASVIVLAAIDTKAREFDSIDQVVL